jgi:hypothetical protein
MVERHWKRAGLIDRPEPKTMSTVIKEKPHTAASPPVGVEPFLLVGSARSGTTMLRLMLDHHPALSCMQESDFIVTHYPACASADPARYARALENDWLWRVSGLQFPKEAPDYRAAVADFFKQRGADSEKTIVGATVLQAFEHLPDLLAEAKYVHLLRDGRPVAASIRSMGWAGNLYVGATRWRKTVEQVRAFQRRIPAERWLEVRYEALVANPTEELSRICTFLGVAFDEAMLRYAGDTSYAAPDRSIAERWRQRLAPREIQLAEMAAGDLLAELGYARMFPPAEPGALERLALRMHHRYRRTLFRFDRYGAYLMIARWLWRRIGVRRAALEARFDAISQAHIK